MRRRLLAAGLLVVASCIDLSTDPHEIVAIEFSPLPWPSVVAGDTLRDASGHAVALQARLFDASGAEVTGQELEFVVRDTMASIAGGKYLVGRATADGQARLYASAAGVQSTVRQIEVVKRPDSLAAQGTIDTLRLSLPDAPERNTSVAIGAKVLTRTTVASGQGVRAWIVNFALQYRGASVAPGDTSLVFLADDAGHPSVLDTSDSQGLVSRHVRFKALPGNIPQLDSVIVSISANHRGAPLAGSPLRRVLPVTAKP